MDPETALTPGEDREARGATPQAFGTSAQTLHQVTPGGCLPDTSSVNYDALRGYRYANSGDAHWDCPLNLPAGAKLDSFEVLVHDESASTLEAVLQICDSLSVDDACFEDGLVSTTGTPSEPFSEFLTSDISGPGYVVDKLNKTYSVRIFLPAASTDLMFRQVNVYYRLQVSPAPGAPSFGDVPPCIPSFDSSRLSRPPGSPLAVEAGTSVRSATSPVARWQSSWPGRWGCTSRTDGPEAPGAYRPVIPSVARDLAA